MTKVLIHPSLPKVDNVPTPDTGFVVLYPKTDGKWYIKRDDGSEIPFSIDISEIINDSEASLTKTFSSTRILTVINDIVDGVASDLQGQIDGKQAALILGSNFGNINGQNLLDGDDITINEGTNFQIIQVEGGSYPSPTAEQLLGSILYIGFDYPVGMAVIDRFQKLISRPTFEPATDVTTTSFTVSWLTPQYIGEPTELDPAPLYDELVNYYLIERSEDNFISIDETVTTSALSYAFDSLATVEQYVRVRAVQEVQPGITIKSDFSDSIIVDLTAAPSDPVLALSPNLYLSGGSYDDQGSQGGTWTNQGTIDTTANVYDLNSSAATIYKNLASALNVGTNGTEQFCAVLWINLEVTTASTRSFLSMINTIFTDSPRLILETRSTNAIRLSRVAAAAADLVTRDATIQKYVVEWRSGTLSVKVNPIVGGSSEFSDTLSKVTGDANINTIALGATVSSASAVTVLGNPIVEKFAFWRGTIPTHDQIAAL